MKFCVVGAGAWGTAFALHLGRGARDVVLVPRRAEQALAISASRENREYLPGIELPAAVSVTADLAEGLSGTDVVLLACPAQTLRQTCALVRAATADAGPRITISLAKGLELGSHMRPTQTISQELAGTLVGALSGPTNAAEVARGLPAAMVLAAKGDEAVIHEVQSAISGPTLRVYTTDDLAGVEFGASLKNIYAIAAGCCEGLGLGDNAKAALMTRAVAEMVKVGGSLGARRETFYGLSGFGDLVATCHGLWSRNREFGQRIGEGRGVGGDLNAWLFNHALLATGRRVYALDLPGHGESTKDVGTGTIDELSQAVVMFMDAVGISAAHVVGHSMGGAVAMALAAREPERVRSLALLASAGLGPEVDTAYIEGFVTAANRNALKPQAAKLFADASLVTRRMIDDLLKYKRLEGVDACLRLISEKFISSGKQAAVWRELLAKLRQPILVVWGSADRVIPASHASRLPASVNVEVIPGKGHMIMMEAAGEVNRLLNAFWS